MCTPHSMFKILLCDALFVFVFFYVLSVNGKPFLVCEKEIIPDVHQCNITSLLAPSWGRYQKCHYNLHAEVNKSQMRFVMH